MTSRRDFLKFNFAAMTALMSGKSVAMFSATTGAEEHPLSLLIVDSSLPVSQEAVPKLSQHVEKIVELKDDLDHLWIKELLPRIDAGETFIAGMTSGNKAFTLQEAARDKGYAILQLQQLNVLDGAANPDELDFHLSRDGEFPANQVNNLDATFWVLGPSGINFSEA